MKVAGIIVAAGRGERAGTEIPKQFHALGGRPVLEWSVRAFADAGARWIVAVVPAQHFERAQAVLTGLPVRLVEGGTTRTASVRAGLEALKDADADAIMVHDAARPGLSAGMIQRLSAALAAGAEACAPSLPIADALKTVDASGRVLGEAKRDGLARVQTPQAFRASALRDAYARTPEGAVFDDDLALFRDQGGAAQLVPGDPRLMKLTYPEDFAMLEAMFNLSRTACVGSGFDAHRFGPGDHVTLCGVDIPHNKGLLGHSDADAGWHALVDAILGAMGDGDIGAHFPPSDPQWRGANSEIFLRHALKRVTDSGARLVHVDVTLICERPKIGPYRDAMRARTAEVLGLPIERVSVKATTTERLGFLGREEGLAAQATATVERSF